MKRWRKGVNDPAHNIWVLERRFLFFFWIQISAGSEQKIDEIVEQFNKEGQR